MDQGQLFISIVGDLGALGFVFWMTWRMTNYTIPRLASQFEEAIDRQRNDFKEMILQQQNFFEKQVEREREFQEKRFSAIINAFSEGA